jgi:hypothetical protein
MAKRLQSVIGLLLATAVAASMWFYVIDILRARQVAESELKNIPRGNLSDLYPRWLGARELLLRHRNPYGPDITLEIQKGYYGRRLDSALPNDPKDQQGFAYPVYVVFLLAPLTGLDFGPVQIFFYWLLAGLTALSVILWLKVLRWRLTPLMTSTVVVLTLGSFAVVQGIKLQQLSLLVAAMLAGCAACIAGGFLFCGGALLALATIKPQLTWLFAGWLILWAFADWRRRLPFLYGLGIFMALLLIGSQVLLRGWLRMFIASIQQYHRYTQNASVLDELVPWNSAGKILAVLAIVLSAVFLWRLRKAPGNSHEFGQAAALVMALTVLVVPMYAPYNQVLLAPGILLLWRDRRLFLSGSRGLRLVCIAGLIAFSWQWITSLTLAAGYFLFSRRWALERWTWPFFATFALPVLVFALVAIALDRAANADGFAE